MTNLEQAELFLQDTQGGAYLSDERREAVKMFAKWLDNKTPKAQIRKYYQCPNCGSDSRDYHEADCPANPHNAY